MTYRQRAGLIIIALVLGLVAIVTSQQTHLIAGSAQAAPVPGPPASGDCVIDPLPGPQPGTTVTATSGGTVPTYPPQQTRPCTAARFGEVVSIIANPKPTVVKGTGDDLYLDDPNVEACSTTAGRYIGLTAQTIQRFWQPYLQVTFALSRPSPRQKASGQHWAACIVAPAPLNGVSSSPAQQYSGSIRDAVRTGYARNRIGACTATADWSAGFENGGCGAPHSLETLAFGSIAGQPVSRTEVEQTCGALVHQLTGLPTPNSSSELATEVHVTDGSGIVITAGRIPADSFMACAVVATGSRKLTSSLLAWGDHPIPWT